MKFTELEIPGVILIEPQVFEDRRGFFCETYSQRKFREAGIDVDFVQDNHSLSSKGTLRGLHFQKEPMAQGKLIRVTRGSVYDVAVDIREGSPTFGKAVTFELNAKDKCSIYIAPGFAHGFCVLEDNTEFLYKCTNFYAPETEGGVAWNDPDLNIPWPKLDVEYTLSDKDQKYPRLKDIQTSFIF